jgi:tetratricopeptide (TPR) repeat protein
MVRFEHLSGLCRPDGWVPIRRAMGIQAFGVNAWSADEAGAELIPEHEESATSHEELYLVLSGRAEFSVNGERFEGGRGTIVLVDDPAAMRGAVAVEAGTTVLSAGAAPGAAFAPRSWEVNRDVFPLLDERRFAEARLLLTEALDQYPEKAELWFNLACAEAQLGEHDAALGHLAAAVAARPDLAAAAGGDEELAPLRGDPRWAEALAGRDHSS